MLNTPLPELELLLREHLVLVHEGKARDSFTHPSFPGIRYVYVSDRISSHDHVLPFQMHRHGEVRNASTVYWKQKLENEHITTDLIAAGIGVDDWLPEPLRQRSELWKRLTANVDAVMEPVENIGRSRLLGSAWGQYANPASNGVVYGQQLPAGLRKGDELNPLLWTPTTKAPKGEHDQPLLAADVERVYPEHKPLTLKVLAILNRYAKEQDTLYADTKLEFGRHPDTGTLLVCDEIGSFDSSRIWTFQQMASWPEGTIGIGTDKDFVRAEMEGLGIKNCDPSTEEGQVAVRALVPSDEFIKEAEELSLASFRVTAGTELEDFQYEYLGIPHVHLYA